MDQNVSKYRIAMRGKKCCWCEIHICLMFPSTTPGKNRKFSITKIQWICFNFDDILLERICLNIASCLKKECEEKLKMFYWTFGMMDISIGYYRKVDKQNAASVT